MPSPTSQHPPFLPPVALSHGEHGRAQADELHDVLTLSPFPGALSSIRLRRGFFFS